MPRLCEPRCVSDAASADCVVACFPRQHPLPGARHAAAAMAWRVGSAAVFRCSLDATGTDAIHVGAMGYMADIHADLARLHEQYRIVFEKEFPNGKQLLTILDERWPETFTCPKCKMTGVPTVTKRGLLWCHHCRKQNHITVGTVFERSHVPLAVWFDAMEQIAGSADPVSASELSRHLDLRRQTVMNMMAKLRDVMARDTRRKLRNRVQIDEMALPGGAGTGHPGEPAHILIAVELKEGGRGGHVALKRVQLASDDLLAAVTATVERGSTIETDALPAYAGLERLGYRHRQLGTEFAVDECRLTACKAVSALIERWLAGTYRQAVRLGNIDSYLAEFAFRASRPGRNGAAHRMRDLLRLAALPAKGDIPVIPDIPTV